MQEQPNILLFIFLAILGLGILMFAGGFDDASVRDLENPQKLSTYNTIFEL